MVLSLRTIWLWVFLLGLWKRVLSIRVWESGLGDFDHDPLVAGRLRIRMEVSTWASSFNAHCSVRWWRVQVNLNGSWAIYQLRNMVWWIPYFRLYLTGWCARSDRGPSCSKLHWATRVVCSWSVLGTHSAGSWQWNRWLLSCPHSRCISH